MIHKLNRWNYNLKCGVKGNYHLRGKVTIIKTYGISKLVYLASLIPNPPIYITNKLNNLIFDFMWNGKGDKIKTKCDD